MNLVSVACRTRNGANKADIFFIIDSYNRMNCGSFMENSNFMSADLIELTVNVLSKLNDRKQAPS